MTYDKAFSFHAFEIEHPYSLFLLLADSCLASFDQLSFFSFMSDSNDMFACAETLCSHFGHFLMQKICLHVLRLLRVDDLLSDFLDAQDIFAVT